MSGFTNKRVLCFRQKVVNRFPGGIPARVCLTWQLWTAMELRSGTLKYRIGIRFRRTWQPKSRHSSSASYRYTRNLTSRPGRYTGGDGWDFEKLLNQNGWIARLDDGTTELGDIGSEATINLFEQGEVRFYE